MLLAWAGASVRAQSESPDNYFFMPVIPVTFFPPAPPVHGAAIEDKPYGRALFYKNRRLTAPDGMADFVCDNFYPALSTRLFIPELSRALEQRLEAYRAKRRHQVNALLNFFVTLHDVSPEERLVQLRVFAAEQTPLLASLEAEAEQLREDLVGTGFWNRIDWNHERRWKLGALSVRNNWAEIEAEFQVIRATSFYQKGLSVQQRGLLREVAMELQPQARKARGWPSPRGDSDAMFFSPETTRFRLPANLSPALREKIAAFNGQKAALKRELREAVLQHDQASASKRAEVFSALGDKQWPQLVALEKLAEEIRLELAASFEPTPPPAPPWLPAGLLETIKSYNEDRDTYFAGMKARADYAAREVPRPDMSGSSDERLQRQAEFAARQAAARREAALEYQKDYETRFAELQQRYKAIREMLTIVAEKQKDPKTGRPLNADTLLREHVASTKEFETFGRETTIYANYRIAMMQPGLSPEQRRLLFGYALVALAQPLPYGEVMPRKDAKQPYASW